MADMDAIEYPEREMQRLAESWQFFKAFTNQHAAGIAVGRGDIKLGDNGTLALFFQRAPLCIEPVIK